MARWADLVDSFEGATWGCVADPWSLRWEKTWEKSGDHWKTWEKTYGIHREIWVISSD